MPARFAETDPCAGGLPPFVPLPATDAEVKAVAHPCGGPSEILTGAAATEAAFKQKAAGHRILHLATHGLAARDTCFGSIPGTRGDSGVCLGIDCGTPRRRRRELAERGVPAAFPGDRATRRCARDARARSFPLARPSRLAPAGGGPPGPH